MVLCFYSVLFLSGLFIASCKEKNNMTFNEPVVTNEIDPGYIIDSSSLTDSTNIIDSTITIIALPDATIYKEGQQIKTGLTIPDSIVTFGKSLVGIPYLYASSDPGKGFDCSGFITYVFNHFGIAVPRSSVDFTDMGHEIPKEFASPGDLILFTGTDSTKRIVGRMGLMIV